MSGWGDAELDAAQLIDDERKNWGKHSSYWRQQPRHRAHVCLSMCKVTGWQEPVWIARLAASAQDALTELIEDES